MTLTSARVRSRSPTISTPSPNSAVPVAQAIRWRSRSRRWRAACWRPQRGGRSGSCESVREANVGPVDHSLAPRDRDADVDGRKRVRKGSFAAMAKVNRRCGEQGQIDHRRRDEQRHAQPRPTEYVTRCKAGEKDRPERDLGRDDESDQHCCLLAGADLRNSSVTTCAIDRLTTAIPPATIAAVNAARSYQAASPGRNCSFPGFTGTITKA
jgi:hypothetical protein